MSRSSASKDMSKHAGGRGGKQIPGCSLKLSSESYAIQFPGALPVKQVVFGRYGDNEWRHALIVHCRLRRTAPAGTNNTAAASGSGGASGSAVEGPRGSASLRHSVHGSSGYEPVQSSATACSGRLQNISPLGCAAERMAAKKATGICPPSAYDYYVHWVKMDRRLDSWLSWDKILSLNDPMPPNVTVVMPQDIVPADDDHTGMDVEYLREHEEATKVKTIGAVFMGPHYVQTWYYSPFPKEYQNVDELFVCEFCLCFFLHRHELTYHSSGCKIKHPPGVEIYRDEGPAVSVWEVDGAFSRVYCENLCFLSKLFLDHKTLRHPVNLFLFYVLCEIRDSGFHIVGYFSKEKYSKNNLSCILTFPQHQRKGMGKFLINFSYALSRQELKRGTPERPLSDLGKASYLACWTQAVLEATQNKGTVTIEELANDTFIQFNDVITCLEDNHVLQRNAKTNEPFIFMPVEAQELMRKRCGKPPPPVDSAKLIWQPYDLFLAPYEYNPNC